MKTLRILLAGAVALMAFAGCENSDELVDDTPVYDDAYYASYASISSSDSNFTSNSTGGTIHFKVSGGEVRLSVSCGTEWTLQNSNPDSFNAYASDSRYLTVSAEQNYVEEELTGTITLMTAGMHITFASITVTQNAYGAPEITVSTNEWNAPAVGNLTIMITVESDAEWTFEGGNEWLTIEKSGTGLNLTAKENEDTEGRETKIVLTCTDGYKSDSETITVTQDGRAYLTVSEESLEFDSNGGEAVVIVESNFEWEYICDSDWLSIEKDEEDGSLKITCDASEVEEDREGIVTFTAGDGASNITEVGLPIAQGAYLMPKITVETEEWNAPAVGELTTEIGVEANYEWTFDVNADWLTAGKTEKGITLTAKENSETNKRSGEIVLSCTDGVKTVSDTIAVTQDGLAYISLSEEELLVSSFGSSVSVTVESNYDWDYVCDADWITITKNEKESSLTVAYTKNETGEDRKAVVTITTGDGAANVAEVEFKIIQSWENTDALILEYTITDNNVNIQLPIYNVTSATIDWDDGTTEITSSNNPAHTYTTPGIYTITINGTVKAIKSYPSSSYGITGSTYLTAVKQWGDTGLTSMYGAFYRCTSLSSLPAETGDSFTNVTTFDHAFYLCLSLESIPTDLFAKCSKAENFSYCFYNCSALIAIPEDLFSKCIIATDFSSCFSSCYGLTTVPEHLFSKCIVATDFSLCFSSCVSLVSAPSFEGLTSATNFNNCFGVCSNLTTLPENMFAGCSKAENFTYCFTLCDSLAAVPENIFAGCSAVTDFSLLFYECLSLKTVPVNIFDDSFLVTDFFRAFSGCDLLEGESPYTEMEMNGEKVKIHLYERGNYAVDMRWAIPSGQDCFYNCTGLTDYDNIPSSWGGNGN